MYFIKFVLVTPCISEEQKGNCQAGCYGLELQNLSKEAVMGDASHAFVRLHAMLVADKWISASPNSTFVKSIAV
ncbi:hypothetical protein AB3S75_001146 [Citrus x aurantiifolia]